ncbi:Nn.00g066410.m01.CDS01 [Neocucurbitaria sp. VM-36]
MTRYTVHNVVGEKTTGYIKREALEQFLKTRYKVSTVEDFDIKETQNKWEFWAPEEIPEADLSALRQKNEK